MAAAGAVEHPVALLDVERAGAPLLRAVASQYLILLRRQLSLPLGVSFLHRCHGQKSSLACYQRSFEPDRVSVTRDFGDLVLQCSGASGPASQGTLTPALEH